MMASGYYGILYMHNGRPCKAYYLVNPIQESLCISHSRHSLIKHIPVTAEYSYPSIPSIVITITSVTILVIFWSCDYLLNTTTIGLDVTGL